MPAPAGQAILLVAVLGDQAVEYLQLCRKQKPCQNFEIPPLQNDVIALPVPVPSTELHITSYTLAGQGSGYVGFGSGGFVSMGYISLDDAKVDIHSSGLYFHAAFDAGTRKVSDVPTEAMLLRAAEKYGTTVTSVQPVDFEWPDGMAP